MIIRPIVAVVGRPNVGKSTLFNKLAGTDLSIVQDKPGVTRDRLYADVELLNYQFTIIDTGGIEPDSDDLILTHMRAQAEIAIYTADVIVFIVDSKTGLVDADYKVADMLRKSKKEIVLCVNKVDNPNKDYLDVYEFYNLGLGEPFGISAAAARGLGDFLDAIVAHFPPINEDDEEDEIPKIAIIGKPNVGKSSLVNKVLGEERAIVSPIAGTTRDAIDSKVVYDGNEYIFIDTAGVRRKSKIKEDIERFSIIRTIAAIERADIVVLLIDAIEGITEQDAKIAGIAHDRGKGTVIAVNKWDAIEKDDKSVYRFLDTIQTTLAFMTYAPVVFISAVTGQRINKLFETLDMVIQNQSMRIATGVVNELLYDATSMNQPPSDKGKRLKVYYMTQVSIKPPTFVAFVNDKQLMHFSYLRYLNNQLREAFGFKGTPVRILVRERKDK
jgi:GTP-binding protein